MTDDWLTFKGLVKWKVAEADLADPPHLVRKHAEDTGPGKKGKTKGMEIIN